MPPWSRNFNPVSYSTQLRSNIVSLESMVKHFETKILKNVRLAKPNNGNVNALYHRISCGEQSLLRNSSQLTFRSVSWDISKQWSESDISASTSFLAFLSLNSFSRGSFASLLKSSAGSGLKSIVIPALPVLNPFSFSDAFVRISNG